VVIQARDRAGALRPRLHHVDLRGGANSSAPRRPGRPMTYRCSVPRHQHHDHAPL